MDHMVSFNTRTFYFNKNLIILKLENNFNYFFIICF